MAIRTRRLLGALVGAGLILVPILLSGQTSTPIAQAIALLTSGTTPFSIVGINASGYINWGTGRSASGYGFRDNAGVIESKNSGGSWSPLSTSGGAPSTATYITQTPNAGLSAEQALSALGTALLKSTTATGVVSAYAGTSCTNQFLTALNAVGVGTCASVDFSTITLTGALGVTNGGTGLATVAQGDLLYGSAADTYSRLTKSTTATRYLSNTGTSNNPAWAQVDVTNGIIGAVPVGNGGTNLTSGTDGGILGFTATGTLASSALLDANQLVLGGGAGATPATLGSLGTTTTVLHGNAAGSPTFAAVNIGTDTTGTLGVATGGTGLTTYAVGDLIYASASTTLARLADVSANSFLRSGGVTTAPVWSTTKWTNSATTGDVLYASGANTYANLADVAAGRYLRSGGVTTAPLWSTASLPNTATTGDLLYASASNVYSNLTAVATGRVLSSAGVATAPVWLTNPSSATFEVSTAFIGPGTEAAAGVLRLANTSTITARNAGNSADLILLSSTAADRVLLGGTNSTGFTLATGSNNFFIQGTTPTISSGFGTTPSIAGTASTFKVTVGSGGDTTGVVLFAFTWSTAPACVANNQTTAQLVRATSPTTTQVTLSGTMAASDIISVHCFGY